MAELRRRRGLVISTQETASLEAPANNKRDIEKARITLCQAIRLLPYLMVAMHTMLAVLTLAWGVDTSKEPRKLGALLRTVSGAMRAHSIEHWVTPGAELLSRGGRRAVFTQYHNTLTLGAHHGQELAVAAALSACTSLAAVETHSGLRIFFATTDNERTHAVDHGYPFVDVLYFRTDGALLVSHCCDCAPSTVAACTKRMCTCLACAALAADVFPTAPMRINTLTLPAPARLDGVLLDMRDVHPAARRTLGA